MILAIWACITAFSAAASWRTHNVQRTEHIAGVDSKLLTAAQMIAAILPEDYHDNIVDKTSVSMDEYLAITRIYNELCLKLDIQYL